MGNMSYCRFENTADDLADCVEHLQDPLTSETEIKARKKIIKLARQIVSETEGEEE